MKRSLPVLPVDVVVSLSVVDGLVGATAEIRQYINCYNNELELLTVTIIFI
jgi:hypothetical protein